MAMTRSTRSSASRCGRRSATRSCAARNCRCRAIASRTWNRGQRWTPRTRWRPSWPGSSPGSPRWPPGPMTAAMSPPTPTASTGSRCWSRSSRPSRPPSTLRWCGLPVPRWMRTSPRTRWIRRWSGGGSPTRSRWPAVCRRSADPAGSAWPGRCTSSCPASARCWPPGGSAKTPQRSSRSRPAISTRSAAGRWTPSCAPPGSRELSTAPRRSPGPPVRLRADPAGYVARGRTTRADRRVTLRPAPDTMSLLTGFLPVEQGVACLAALRRHTDRLLAAGDARGRGQIMADTLVERLTGQARAADVNVEVGIVMSLDSLVGDAGGAAREAAGTGTAEVVGQGPIPAGIAHDLLQATEGKRWWRRLFTMPEGGPLVGGDPRRRAFDGVLAGADRGARRRPLSRPVLRRPDPARRPHPPVPGGRPDELRERARGMCPRELRAGDARLAGGCRRRRARPTSAYGAHDHPDRPHLHQHRRACSVASPRQPSITTPGRPRAWTSQPRR